MEWAVKKLQKFFLMADNYKKTFFNIRVSGTVNFVASDKGIENVQYIRYAPLIAFNGAVRSRGAPCALRHAAVFWCAKTRRTPACF